MKDLLGSDRSTVQPVPPLPIDQRRPQLPTISPLWPPSTPSPHVYPAHTSAFTIPNIKLAKTVFANSSLIKPASAAFIERESRCPCEGLEAATAHQTQTPTNPTTCTLTQPTLIWGERSKLTITTWHDESKGVDGKLVKLIYNALYKVHNALKRIFHILL